VDQVSRSAGGPDNPDPDKLTFNGDGVNEDLLSAPAIVMGSPWSATITSVNNHGPGGPLALTVRASTVSPPWSVHAQDAVRVHPPPAPQPRPADLQSKILALREREAKKQARADPAMRLATSAVKSIDKALAATESADMRKALTQACSTLAGHLRLDGASMSRSAANDDLPGALLSYVRSNRGQRSEQIAAALSTDAGTLRPVMKRLIAAGQIRTEGQRRGMTYAAM